MLVAQVAQGRLGRVSVAGLQGHVEIAQHTPYGAYDFLTEQLALLPQAAHALERLPYLLRIARELYGRPPSELRDGRLDWVVRVKLRALSAEARPSWANEGH